MENEVGRPKDFFPYLFISFYVSSFCFLIVFKKNSKSHTETTLGKFSDILVICYESAYCILMMFLPRIILVGLPAVCSDIGILEFGSLRIKESKGTWKC